MSLITGRLPLAAAVLCGGLVTPACGEDAPKVVEPVARIITAEEFESRTYSHPDKLDQVREWFVGSVYREIQFVHDYCPLTAEQKTQLRKTGDAEFALWQQRLAELRSRVVGRAVDPHPGSLVEIQMSTFRIRPNGPPMERDCPFQRTLLDVLTLDQFPGYVEYQRAARKRQIDRVFDFYENRKPPSKPWKLPPEARKQITKLLLDETPPLQGNGEYANVITVLQMHELKDRIQPLFSAEEWTRYEEELFLAWGMEGRLRGLKLWPIPTESEKPVSTPDQ